MSLLLGDLQSLILGYLRMNILYFACSQLTIIFITLLLQQQLGVYNRDKISVVAMLSVPGSTLELFRGYAVLRYFRIVLRLFRKNPGCI
jgi:hypothetical protein